MTDITQLKTDLDRLHRERDSFQQHARLLAEEVERHCQDAKYAPRPHHYGHGTKTA